MKHFCLVLMIGLLAACSGGSGKKQVKIETEFGDMIFELYDSTPQHRDNFLKLAGEGFYKDLLFHRVIDGFMIQGGDPQSRGADASARLGSGGPGYTIPAEIGAPHFKGTLAAARTGGPSNPEKKSSGSQFYIVQGKPQSDLEIDNAQRSKKIEYSPAQREKYKTDGGAIFLDMEYTVFGEIIQGMEIIGKLAGVKTAPGDRPIEDVKFNVIPL